MKNRSMCIAVALVLSMVISVVAAETKPVRTGSGVMTFDTVPGWGLRPDGKSALGPTHGGVVVDSKGNIYTSANKGVVVFENSDIGLNLGTASESTILSTVEALLEESSSTNAFTGDQAQVAKGGLTTDALLVFGAQTGGGTGSVIIRYDENADGDSDDPFDDELSLTAVFFGALNLQDVNII